MNGWKDHWTMSWKHFVVQNCHLFYWFYEIWKGIVYKWRFNFFYLLYTKAPFSFHILLPQKKNVGHDRLIKMIYNMTFNELALELALCTENPYVLFVKMLHSILPFFSIPKKKKDLATNHSLPTLLLSTK